MVVDSEPLNFLCQNKVGLLVSWSNILQIFFYFQTLKDIYYSFLTVPTFSEYICIYMFVMLWKPWLER